MTQHGAWVSYGGDARIELAVGLLATAGAVVYAGTRLRHPVRAVRPGQGTVAVMFLAWAVAIVGLLVGISFYIQQYLRDNHLTKITSASDPVTPVTLLAVVAIFVVILTRGGLSSRARLGSAIIGALAAPWIFELPFDLIVMARTASLQPDPALYRAAFFVPLFLVAITTLALLILSPMVRLTRATFFTFALMLLVFAVWALDGFGYPSAPAPIALNMVSKVLAFATALTLFLSRPAAPEQLHHLVGDLDLSFEAMELPSQPGLTLLVYTASQGSPAAASLNLLASWAATAERTGELVDGGKPTS